jgi:mutator protein MutT
MANERGTKSVEVAVAVVQKGQKILICRRKSTGVLADFWEFPGGKCEPGETLQACAIREVKEEVGLDVEIVASLTPVCHQYDYGQVTLYPFVCRHLAGEAIALAAQKIQWIEPRQLSDFHFPPANQRLLREIQSHRFD